MTELDFFDCNTRIGRPARPSPGAFHTKKGLLAEMDYLGISEALVYHVDALGSSVGNTQLLDEINGETRLHGCWILPPHYQVDFPDPASTVDEMLNHGVTVARIVPPYYHANIVADWASGGLFQALEAHRVPLMIAGSQLGKHPDDTRPGYSAQNVYDICTTYPRLPVVIVHLNWSATRILIPLMKACPNLLVEISYYSSHRGVEFLAQHFGAERILFGTGMPETGRVALAMVTYAAVSAAERQLIAGGNLRALLAQVQ